MEDLSIYRDEDSEINLGDIDLNNFLPIYTIEAKNLFLSRSKSIKRKIQEFVLALWLEHKFSKKQIDLNKKFDEILENVNIK